MIMLLCHREYANLLLVVRYDMTIQDEKRLDDDTDLVTCEMGPSHGNTSSSRGQYSIELGHLRVGLWQHKLPA